MTQPNEATTRVSPKSVRDRGRSSAMRLLGPGVVQKQKCPMRFSQTGNASTRLGWAGRLGRRAGKRPQRMAKRLTFTEGRLRLTLQKSLPDLKVRRLDRRGEIRWRRP